MSPFSATRRTNDAQDLPRWNIQRDIVKHHHVAIAVRYVLRFQVHENMGGPEPAQICLAGDLDIRTVDEGFRCDRVLD